MRISYLLIFVFAVFVSCKDSDGDGVYDKYDNCPEIEGLKEHEGCPDADADGVIDSEDECPDEFGLEEFKGCPDTDEDGVPDNEDDCPETSGLEKFNGCPNNNKMKLLASDCFKALSLSEKEINDCLELYEIKLNTTINYKYCELIHDYVKEKKELEREYNLSRSETQDKIDNIQRQIDGGYIQRVFQTKLNGKYIQKLIVLKNNHYYLMEVGNGRECTMGTMIFNENTYNWQDVYIRQSPSEEKYSVYEMRIIDENSNYNVLNQKLRVY